MKLKTIASAVSVSLAALALTACGGSDNSAPVNQPSATDAAKAAAEAAAKAEAEKKAAEEAAKKAAEEAAKKAAEEAAKKAAANNKVDSTVITTQNPLVTGFDTDKLTSVNTGHYVRSEDSTYDLISNPKVIKNKDVSDSGTTLNPTLNIQNPRLSNYVLGAELAPTLDANGNRVVWAIDYAGEYISTAGSEDGEPLNTPSLTGYKVNRANGTIDPVNVAADRQRKVLQFYNKSNVDVNLQGGANNAVAAGKVRLDKNNLTRTAGQVDADGKTGLVAYSAALDILGNTGSAVLEYGMEERQGHASHFDANDKTFPNKLQVSTNIDVGGAAPVNSLTTRVFGKNYKNTELAADLNVQQSYENTYKPSYVPVTKDGVTTNNFQSLVPYRLQHVQYGRLTNNIDSLAEDPNPNQVTTLVRRDFAPHNDKTAVDTYFYRGTNETTLAQMEAVKAKGGTLSYQGHALTYGIEPFASVAPSQGLPNSFGKETAQDTFGNFAQLTYDVAKGTVDGSIYNFRTINKNDLDKAPYTRQDLVTFTGEVHGNTMIGSSTKLLDKSAGNFRGSFFGPSASEVGGNLSSTTTDVGYGAAKWGAVFGASLVNPVGGNVNIGTTGPGTTVGSP